MDNNRSFASVNPRELLGYADQPEVQRPCRTIREMEDKMERLRRENFDLKLQRYLDEERRKKANSTSPNMEEQIAVEKKLRLANRALVEENEQLKEYICCLKEANSKREQLLKEVDVRLSAIYKESSK